LRPTQRSIQENLDNHNPYFGAEAIIAQAMNVIQGFARPEHPRNHGKQRKGLRDKLSNELIRAGIDEIDQRLVPLIMSNLSSVLLIEKRDGQDSFFDGKRKQRFFFVPRVQGGSLDEWRERSIQHFLSLWVSQ